MILSFFLIVYTIYSSEELKHLPEKNGQFKENTIKNSVQKLFDEIELKNKHLCPSKPTHDLYEIDLDEHKFQQYQTIYGCNINSAKHINANECQILICKCTFQSIKTPKNGGAIYIYLSNEIKLPEKNNLIEKCMFIQCSAIEGGALYLFGSQSSFLFNIVDNLFQNNQASEKGGAIYYSLVNGNIKYNHFINNICPYKNGSHIVFDFSIPNKNLNEILNVQNNKYDHFPGVGDTKSLIYFIHKESVYFIFTDNTINISKPGSDFHIFDCFHPNLEFKGSWLFDNNCIVSLKYFEKVLQSTNFNFNLAGSFNNICTTEIPTELVNYNVFDDGKYELNKRCLFQTNEERRVFVLVLVSEFKKYIEKDEDGGAINVLNCGLICNSTIFTSCVSVIGGGGAIYFKNAILSFENDLRLTNLQFNGCKAIYGGAAYIYSISKYSNNSIHNCSFNSNEILQRSSISIYSLFGGSSIFLTVRNGFITNCTFNSNRGESGSFKIYGIFDKDSFLIHPFNEDDVNHSIMIYNCKFENERKSGSSIYFVNKNEGSSVDLINCSFFGKLNDGEFYIDGQLQDKNSKKIFIQSCFFSDTTKIAGNKGIVDKLWMVNAQKIIFDLFKKIVIIVLISELIVIIFFYFVKKFYNKNKIILNLRLIN